MLAQACVSRPIRGDVVCGGRAGEDKDKPNQILTKALSHYKTQSVNNKENDTYNSCELHKSVVAIQTHKRLRSNEKR